MERRKARRKGRTNKTNERQKKETRCFCTWYLIVYEKGERPSHKAAYHMTELYRPHVFRKTIEELRTWQIAVVEQI